MVRTVLDLLKGELHSVSSTLRFQRVTSALISVVPTPQFSTVLSNTEYQPDNQEGALGLWIHALLSTNTVLSLECEVQKQISESCWLRLMEVVT